MSFPPKSKVERVQAWIEKQQPGAVFSARDIGKQLNQSGHGVGCTLKWQDNVKKVGLVDGVSLWKRVSFPPKSKVERVQAWIEKQQPGAVFSARDIGKQLNQSRHGVGCTLKWQDNVKKVGLVDGVSLWKRV